MGSLPTLPLTKPLRRDWHPAPSTHVVEKNPKVQQSLRSQILPSQECHNHLTTTIQPSSPTTEFFIAYHLHLKSSTGLASLCMPIPCQPPNQSRPHPTCFLLPLPPPILPSAHTKPNQIKTNQIKSNRKPHVYMLRFSHLPPTNKSNLKKKKPKTQTVPKQNKVKTNAQKK
jgi:hypothetical protein